MLVICTLIVHESRGRKEYIRRERDREREAWEAEVAKQKKKRVEHMQTILDRMGSVSPNLVGKILDDVVIYNRCVERLKKAVEVFLLGGANQEVEVSGSIASLVSRFRSIHSAVLSVLAVNSILQEDATDQLLTELDRSKLSQLAVSQESAISSELALLSTASLLELLTERNARL